MPKTQNNERPCDKHLFGTHHFSGGSIVVEATSYGVKNLLTFRRRGKMLSATVTTEELKEMRERWDRMAAQAPTGPFGRHLAKRVDWT